MSFSSTVWSVDSWILFKKFCNWLQIVIISFYVMLDHPFTCSLFKQCIFWGDIWCLCEVAAVKRWQETREIEQRCSCSCSASSALSHRGNPTPVFVRTNTCKHGCRMLTSQRTKVVKEEQLNWRLQELLLLLLQREVKFVMTYGWTSLADEMTNRWLPS